MKKKLIVLVAAVVILFVAIHLWVPGKVPAGQSPLVRLSSVNVSQFERAFDGDADTPRLVLMLSPT